MPLTRPHSPFRSQPVERGAPRKGAAVVRGDELGYLVPGIKAQRKAVKLGALVRKPELRVLKEQGTEA